MATFSVRSLMRGMCASSVICLGKSQSCEGRKAASTAAESHCRPHHASHPSRVGDGGLRQRSGRRLSWVAKENGITRQRLDSRTARFPQRLDRGNGIQHVGLRNRPACLRQPTLQILLDALLCKKAGRIEVWPISCTVLATCTHEIGFGFFDPLTRRGFHGEPCLSPRSHG